LHSLRSEIDPKELLAFFSAEHGNGYLDLTIDL
jgi:hypothetical protein